MMRVGIIGAGARMKYLLGLVKEREIEIDVVAVMDLDTEKAEIVLKESGVDTSKVTFYSDADEFLKTEKLDGIMIGTNCSSHTDYALKVMKYNLPLYLEKPVSINNEQLKCLYEGAKLYKNQAVVSFPLRVSPLCQLAKELILSDAIGRVEHVQAINNVPYGRVYYKEWYRNDKETGGLFLQKATHDVDYINYLLGMNPKELCAVQSKQIFKGEKSANLKCEDCDEYFTCNESSYAIKHTYQETFHGNMCSYAVDTGNQDSGTIIMKYATGMHAVYSQNFIARKKAATRGARLIGYKGTMEFDWYKDSLNIYSHTTSKVETHQFETGSKGHGGGDYILLQNFVDVMKGKSSISPLASGIESALVCMKAEESSKTNQFVTINF